MDSDVTLDAGTARRLRDWLHDTAAELPDDQALLGRIKHARAAGRPAFRPALPWRRMRIAGATALAVSIVVGTGLALRTPPTESRFGSAAVSPSPFPMPPMPIPAGPLEPGRYAFPEDASTAARVYEVSLNVPAGWQSNNGGWVLDRGDGDPPAGATVEIEDIDWIVVDPCGREQVRVPVPPGSSLESVAAILGAWGADTGARSASSPTTTEPVFGTFDGRPGVELTVQTPSDVNPNACLNGNYELWGDDPVGTRWIQGAGESMRLRVIQVGSNFAFLGAGSFAGTPEDVLAEQQAMLDSVRITPRVTDPSPSHQLETLPNVSGDQAPGRYRVDPTWLALGDEHVVSLELPAGWDISNGIISSPDHVGTSRVPQAELDLFVIDKIVSDPCAHEGKVDGHPWYDLDWFAASLTTEWSPDSVSTNPMTTVPSFTEFDGYPGFELIATVPMDLDLGACAGGAYHLWTYADGSSPRLALRGDELLIRVIAVEPLSGTDPHYFDPMRSGYLSIVATTRAGTRPEARAELLAMVDSVRITPRAINPSPMPSVSGGGS